MKKTYCSPLTTIVEVKTTLYLMQNSGVIGTMIPQDPTNPDKPAEADEELEVLSRQASKWDDDEDED